MFYRLKIAAFVTGSEGQGFDCFTLLYLTTMGEWELQAPLSLPGPESGAWLTATVVLEPTTNKYPWGPEQTL